jgi:brefeldin A-inhibited guanine nucleotide-exchange protein 3
LCRALQITLFPLHQIMAPFYQGSANFYGDLGQVKVAARRDSCRRECHRLLQLAQQVAESH